MLLEATNQVQFKTLRWSVCVFLILAASVVIVYYAENTSWVDLGVAAEDIRRPWDPGKKKSMWRKLKKCWPSLVYRLPLSNIFAQKVISSNQWWPQEPCLVYDLDIVIAPKRPGLFLKIWNLNSFQSIWRLAGWLHRLHRDIFNKPRHLL